MPEFSRRRFLTIFAAAGTLATVPFTLKAQQPIRTWKGVAMGAAASISLSHPNADNILSRATRELERLENIFSLYREHSTLAQLNRDGVIDAPPFEFLECLGLCGIINRASGGLFDPTVQSLWRLYAQSHSQGRPPENESIRETLFRTGWDKVAINQGRVSFKRPNMAMTLNGIAQGYVADRIAKLLRHDGLNNVLINTGEFAALGGHPEGKDWPVSIDTGLGIRKEKVMLRDNALATSLPNGTFFDQAGLVGHIIDPRTGRPTQARTEAVSVTATSAAVADGLSTAICLMSKGEAAKFLTQFPSAQMA
ncbi:MULTISPECIES: FAD:protein FMN transferase [unclassified Thalassospira]|uniref:FAD:protein FMN transferase n=1 Tax=unclassified Thalassospira TaxID=2648997 RepID=UPI001B1345FA|nr:FAD:protein FMN transferase [Thalassospira sp.]MBO6773612.1 FAD:protein FMN transferase [Thalassospira sp.]